MILADLPPPSSPAAVGWILLALAAAAVAITGIGAYIRREAGVRTPEAREIAGQPLRVTQEPKYVPVETYERDSAAVRSRIDSLESQVRDIHQELRGIRSDMHSMELRIIQGSEDRAGKIHERINLLLVAVSNLRVRTGGDATPV